MIADAETLRKREGAVVSLETVHRVLANRT